MAPIKCLVTGGAGFIGSHVTDALVKAGYDVYVLDNLSTGRYKNVNTEATFFQGDIRKLWQYDLPDVQYVFHLAALARIQPSIENPVEAHDVNLTGTLNVLEYCRSVGAKIIFSSSSSTYADSPEAVRENSPKDLKNPYAAQKAMCEEYILLYSKLYGLDYCIFRYFNVFGERQILEGAYAAIVGIFLDQKQKGRPLTITNDGEQRRDFTYVADVADANLRGIEWTGIFNIGTGKNYSINEIADFVGGKKTYIGERRGEARNTLANNSRALAHGWEPTVDIKDWIQSHV